MHAVTGVGRQCAGGGRKHVGALEAVKIDPEVVGVEELVLAHILKGIFVLVGRLRRLAQDEAAIRLALSQVASLLVSRGALRHLCKGITACSQTPLGMGSREPSFQDVDESLYGLELLTRGHMIPGEKRAIMHA